MSSADPRAEAADQPPVVVSSPVGASAWCRAAAALGWSGVVVEDVTLLGARVTVVAEVDWQVHAHRHASGWCPIVDYTTLAMCEDWPEGCVAPPSAVRLVGFLAWGRRWQQSLRRVGGFVGFGSTGIVLDPGRAATDVCRMTAHYYGIAVTRVASSGEVELVQPGRVGPVTTARPTSISREAEEQVYREMLDRGLAPVPEV